MELEQYGCKLVKETEIYNYDLDNKDFVDFAEKNGYMQYAGILGSVKRTYRQNTVKTKEQFMKCPVMRKSILGYEYSENEMELNWIMVRLARAKLQNCWNVFLHRNKPEDTSKMIMTVERDVPGFCNDSIDQFEVDQYGPTLFDIAGDSAL